MAKIEFEFAESKVERSEVDQLEGDFDIDIDGVVAALMRHLVGGSCPCVSDVFHLDQGSGPVGKVMVDVAELQRLHGMWPS